LRIRRFAAKGPFYPDVKLHCIATRGFAANDPEPAQREVSGESSTAARLSGLAKIVEQLAQVDNLTPRKAVEAGMAFLPARND
jgi:hypothetical protein